MKLGDIAQRLECKLEGDAGIEITGVAGIEEAAPGQLTFLANRRYRPAVATTRASAILIAPGAGDVPFAALRSKNPYLDFARALEFFHPAPKYSPEIHPMATVSRTAKIEAGAHIGPYCRRKRPDRTQRGFAQLRHNLSRRENWRRFFRPFARDCPRRMPHWTSRYASKQRRDWLRRIRVCKAI